MYVAHSNRFPKPTKDGDAWTIKSTWDEKWQGTDIGKSSIDLRATAKEMVVKLELIPNGEKPIRETMKIKKFIERPLRSFAEQVYDWYGQQARKFYVPTDYSKLPR